MYRVKTLASYDSKNGFGGLISSLQKMKQVQPVSDDIEKYFNALSSGAIKTTTNVSGLAKALGTTDKYAIEFTQKIKDGTIVLKEGQTYLQGYQMYLQSVGKTSMFATVKTQALSVAMKALSSIGWMALFTVITSVIGKGIEAIDNWIHRVEKANETMNNAVNEYELAKSSLESISTELEEQGIRIDELNSKDKLTYAEQGELEELKEITKELALQQDIEERRSKKASKEAADSAVEAFKTQYGDYDISEENVENLLSLDRYGLSDDYENDIAGNIAELQRTIELLNQAEQDYKQALADGEDTTWIESEVQRYTDMVGDYEDLLDSSMSSLSDKRIALQDEYDKAIEKRDEGIEPLATNEKDYIETYEAILDIIKLIYQYTDQNAWNTIEISDIFNTDGIEKTKEELVSMAKSGELTPEMLSGYKNLNEAIENSEIFLKNGQTAAEAFCDELYAIAEAEGQIESSTLTDETPVLSISDSIKQISEQVEPQFSKLKEAYQDIFTIEDGKEVFSLDKVDTSMLEDLRSTFAEIEEEVGVTFDTTELEKFFNVLTNGNSTEQQVQTAFDDLATSYLYSTDVLSNLNDTTVEAIAKQLESLGLTNAESIATEILATNKALLAETGEDLSSATAETINSLIEENGALTEEGLVLDETTQKIVEYWMQKQLANGTLDTVGDIKQLEGLCDALGISCNALRNYIYFKKLASMTDVYDADSIARFADNAQKQLGKAKEDIKGLSAIYGDYSPKNTDTSKSSAKDTTESFDWIKRAIEKVEKEISRLDKVVDSTFSTVSGKNDALAKQIELINQEIQLQQQAYEQYMAKAESVALSDDYKNLVQNGSINIEDITDKDLQKAINNYQTWYEKAKDTQDKINDLYEQSNEYHVKAYELHLSELDTLRDNESITEKEYLDRKLALWEKYYKDNVRLANQAKEAKLELLNEEIDFLETVANAASDILDERIDALEDSRDSIIDGYQSQIEALEEQKKPLEEALDLMEKAREKQEKILALQKAQYELRRAEEQRNKLTYVDGQMVYKADQSTIRDAKDDVDEAEYELAKFKIQEQIDQYDKQIDKLNDLIDSTNKYYDNEVENVEKLKNEWQKALELQERAANRANFESMFGEGSIAKLLAGDLSMVNQWKQDYLGTLEEIDLTTQGKIGDITAKYAELAGIDLSDVSNQTKDVTSRFSEIRDSVGDVTTALVGGESSSPNETPTGDNQGENGEKETDKSGGSDSLQGAIETVSGTIANATEQHVDGIMNEVIPAIEEEISAMEQFNEVADMDIEKTVTISYQTTGVGNAYADGTRKAEKGLAIVGEEKPEIVKTNDDKVLLADSPTLLNMEGGETVYNGDETKQILAHGLRDVTEEDFPLLKVIKQYSPEEIRQRFTPTSYDLAKQFNASIASSMSNSVNNTTNNNSQSVSVGDIHVHCPGITKDEVAVQATEAIRRELFGIYNQAYQRVNKTR